MAIPTQFDASIISAKNENTLAFANANIDFALVKVEIPKQFEGLGKALSTIRKHNAEGGQQHRTARRLGALFEQLIPDISMLVAAYGERASEIATSSQWDMKSTEYGPFAGHVGVDGTSIYAAASSGSSVIALHLLACMLARVFSSAEATAIWVQMVECRLNEITEKADKSQLQGLAALYAAEHGRQIMREDLAAWDASARAWLQTANQVKRREDTQLKLIVKNIQSIQSSGKTYSNVIENWIFAMTTVQKLIQGVPQEITNGSILLGLMSWHIYPDLNVFNPTRYIKFNDNLVKDGGIVTLGLEQKDGNNSGVSWSISLSHLRYYGAPVEVEKSSGEDSDRVTAQELRLITFGCVLASWANPASVKIIEAAECFAALGDALEMDSSPSNWTYSDPLSWVALLVDASRCLLAAEDKDRETAIYFVEFGRRRGRKFLDESFRWVIPMFGLASPYLIFKLSGHFNSLRTDPEASIAHLRSFAEECQFHRDDCIIVSSSVCKSDENDTNGFQGNWEMASAIPAPKVSGKRTQDGEQRTMEQHTRWIHVTRTQDPLLQQYLERRVSAYEDFKLIPDPSDEGLDFAAARACQCFAKGRMCDARCHCHQNGFKCTSLCSCMKDFCGLGSLCCQNIRDLLPESGIDSEDCFWLSTKSTLDIEDGSLKDRGRRFAWRDAPASYADRYANLEGPETPSNALEIDNDDFMPWIREDLSQLSSYSLNTVGRNVPFRPVEVNGTAGLFISDRAIVNIPWLTLPNITAILRSKSLDMKKLRDYLTSIPENGIRDHTNFLEGTLHHSALFFGSLQAASAISEMYSEWPETTSTICISITKQPLGRAHWASNVTGYPPLQKPHQVWRSTKFACLAMLESGSCDLHPDQLELVMAMATGNSIYAVDVLLQDPSLTDHSVTEAFKGIRRIIGNVGHPGVVMLIPPPAPQVLSVDDAPRGFVQADPFDGQSLDLFSHTSLHPKVHRIEDPTSRCSRSC